VVEDRSGPIELAGIYRRLIGARIRADWQYRTSFTLLTAGQMLFTIPDFVVVAMIFDQVPRLAGWTLAEVAFLYGLSDLAFALADIFVSQVESLVPLIKQGSFDRLLTRPMSPLIQVSAEFFALRQLGRVVAPILALGLAVSWLNLQWNAQRVLLTVMALGAATVIFSALWIMTSAITFWAVDSSHATHSITYGGRFLTQYPLSILGEWLRRLVIYILPLAFVAYLPTVVILDKPDPLGLPRALGYASPAVAVILAFAARAIWATAIRHYRSTGS